MAYRGRSISLRIKKIYFDRILEGTKKVEYRACKDFYTRMLDETEGPIKRLVLHYQSARRLIVKVKRIDLIETPGHLDRTLIPTEQVYAIHLGKILEYIEG